MEPAFEIISKITAIENIAIDNSIYEIERLKRIYGSTGRWKKINAMIRLKDGYVIKAELHWYECHGIGKKDIKIKRFIE